MADPVNVRRKKRQALVFPRLDFCHRGQTRAVARLVLKRGRRCGLDERRPARIIAAGAPTRTRAVIARQFSIPGSARRPAGELRWAQSK